MATFVRSLAGLSLGLTLTAPALAQVALGPAQIAPTPAQSAPAPRQSAPAPRQSAPAPRQSAPAPGDFSSARVTFTSDPKGLSFYRVTSLVIIPGRRGPLVGHAFEPLCSAPCSLGMPVGKEQFAIAYPEELPRLTEPVVIPWGTTEVYGHFESRAELRAWGWTLLVASAVAGTAMLVTGLNQKTTDCFGGVCMHEPDTSPGLVIGGSVLLIFGVGAGILMARTPDVAHVETR